MKPRMGFPIQDTADRIASVDAVPETDDVLRIPNEQTLKGRDQELPSCKLAYKFTEVFIPCDYFPIAVIQNFLRPRACRQYDIKSISGTKASIREHLQPYLRPKELKKIADKKEELVAG
jgi:hypothetical protein